MRKLLSALFALGLISSAHAQLLPFTPTGYSVTPLSATNSSQATTMPLGTQSVLVQNVGSTNAVYCQPGASATTSSVAISPQGGAILPMGANTQIACLTSTSTSTVNFIPGVGYSSYLYGGGGGGGGGGGLANCGAAGFVGSFGCLVDESTSSQFHTDITSPILGPINITPTDCSGTITSGGTAQNAFSATATIHGFQIANIDASAGSGEPLWFSETTTAAASTTQSYPLPPPQATSFAGYGTYVTPFGLGVNKAVSVIAATTGHKFSCTYW